MTKLFSLRKRKAHKNKTKHIKRFRYNFYKKYINYKTLPDNKTQKKEIIKSEKIMENKVNNKEELNISNELIIKTLAKFSNELGSNYWNSYINDISNDLLEIESKINKKVINEEILGRYKLTKNYRKEVLKYFLEFINNQQIDIKFYFSTVSVFDLFLINYAENNSNCENFFISKKSNQFSWTKLLLLLLCCFYLIAKNDNRITISVKQLLEVKNAKEEVNDEDLNNLIYNIIRYTDVRLSEYNLYDYIHLYLVINVLNMKTLTINQEFLNNFLKFSFIFSIKIIQNIDLLNISKSIQALGIICVSFDYSKHKSKENNDDLFKYFHRWFENIEKNISNYNRNDLEKVIRWLNSYLNK